MVKLVIKLKLRIIIWKKLKDLIIRIKLIKI